MKSWSSPFQYCRRTELLAQEVPPDGSRRRTAQVTARPSASASVLVDQLEDPAHRQQQQVEQRLLFRLFADQRILGLDGCLGGVSGELDQVLVLFQRVVGSQMPRRFSKPLSSGWSLGSIRIGPNSAR